MFTTLINMFDISYAGVPDEYIIEQLLRGFCDGIKELPLSHSSYIARPSYISFVSAIV